MKMYIALTIVAGGLIGGYHVNERYERLSAFHVRYLETPTPPHPASDRPAAR